MSRATEAALARLVQEAAGAIRDERRRRSMSMATLADRAGVAVGTVQALEAGVVGGLESYARLATALGLRPSLVMARDLRRGPPPPTRPEADDFVHAAMGEQIVQLLAQSGATVAIDEPYQHYQFAGRADVLAWRDRDLLHVENRTRFPNIQEAAGSYNAKRRYLASALADRLGVGPAGWRSVTHVMACLWSAEVLHVLRLRPATFHAICPDASDDALAWLHGGRPSSGASSTLLLIDPGITVESRRRAMATMDDVDRVAPRYRGYAEAAEALRGMRR